MAMAIKFVAKLVIFLGFLLISCSAQGAPLHGQSRRGLADAEATVFDVTKHGAVADGITDNVQAFMQAWIAACRWRGPSKLLIPPGKFLVGQVAFEGPCNSPEPLIFEVQGNVMAQTDVSEYPSAEWFIFENVNNMILKGTGTFDGQGSSAWMYNDCKKNINCQILPTSLKFNKVNSTIVQDITSVDSKGFHYFITNSFNVTVFNATIIAPDNSPNTDGIHLSKCDTIRIYHTNIRTGDDCISIGQGTTNINVSDVYCGPGHGLSIGSLGKYPNEQDVMGVFVTNCSLNGTTNGARIKTWPGSPPSKASNIVFQDIIMNSVKNPVIIDQKYGSHAAKPSRVKVSDVLFKNLRGTTISKVAVTLACSDIAPCDAIQLQDINFSYNGPPNYMQTTPFSSSCTNVKTTYSGTQSPAACAA